MSGKIEKVEFTWKLFPSSKIHEVSDNSDSNQTPKIYYIHHWFGALSTEHVWTKSADRITNLCLLK